MLYGDTSSWNHFTNKEGGGLDKIQDLLLRQEAGGEAVSSVFQYISHVSSGLLILSIPRKLANPKRLSSKWVTLKSLSFIPSYNHVYTYNIPILTVLWDELLFNRLGRLLRYIP